MTLSKTCQESLEWPSHDQNTEKRLCGLIVLQVLVHDIISFITTLHGVSAWWKKTTHQIVRELRKEKEESRVQSTL